MSEKGRNNLLSINGDCVPRADEREYVVCAACTEVAVAKDVLKQSAYEYLRVFERRE